jgi:hypothetical protein
MVVGKNLTQKLFDRATQRPGSEWRRRSQRRDLQEAVVIRNEGVDVFANTINVSTSAMTVKSQRPLNAGLQVNVRHASVVQEWYGMEVMHCTKTIGGFKIGLRLVEKGDTDS